MRVRLADRERAGRAVDLVDAGLDPERVAAAVRADDGVVECPSPGVTHDHVGLVTPGVTLGRQVALAAAARSRGLTPPEDEELDRVRAELAAVDPPAVDLAAARDRVGRAGRDVDRRRERVAALRGQVQARREAGLDASDAAAALGAAAGELAEAETERAAAEQSHERARERAREARDARERRLRLEDRVANLERTARGWLADRVRPEADAAVRAAAWTDADAYAAADPVTAALAVARVAALAAPVVLACRRFPDARSASDWLDAPLLRV